MTKLIESISFTGMTTEKVPFFKFPEDDNLRQKWIKSSDRTEPLLEILMSRSPYVLNEPEASHSYVHDDRKGRPDVTLGSNEIVQVFDAWSVDDGVFSYSDITSGFTLFLIPHLRPTQHIKQKTKVYLNSTRDSWNIFLC